MKNFHELAQVALEALEANYHKIDVSDEFPFGEWYSKAEKTRLTASFAPGGRVKIFQEVKKAA